MLVKLKTRWRRYWMKLAKDGVVGRFAARMARIGLPPHTGALVLARLFEHGYVSPDAVISHQALHRGKHTFIGDGVMIYQEGPGGAVTLHDGVHLYSGSTLQTGAGGTIEIGAETHVQPRCQFSAYLSGVRIGKSVEIAPACAFYPYNHAMAAGIPVREQPLTTRGGIVIEDEAWLGYGVIVLDGAHIGRGAVIAAGAVVSGHIPENAIAAGVPARVVGHRQADGVVSATRNSKVAG